MIKIIFAILVIFCMMITPSGAATDLLSPNGITISLVNQNPQPAVSGDTVEVRFGIENTGSDTISNLMIEMIPEYPFTLVSGEPAVQKITTLSSYQYGDNMQVVTYNIKIDQDALAGGHELKLKYYYQGSTSKIEKSITIDVKGKEMAEIIRIDQTNLVPGKQSSLNFTINNVGKAPLKNLVFNWVNDAKIILPVGSDNTKYIKYIEIGDSVELEYQVIADPNAPPGLYELKLYLTYNDPLLNADKEISTIAGINVGGGTDFDVAFSESSDTQTSFTVANIGSNAAYSVSVIVPSQNGWQVSGSNSMIIGNLNKGDYTVASFNLKARQQLPATQGQDASRRNVSERSSQNYSSQNSPAQGSQTLKIQINYTDTMGERKSLDKDVIVSQAAAIGAATIDAATGMPVGRQRAPQQNAFTTYQWYIAGFIILVIGGVYYRKYKQKKLIESLPANLDDLDK